jgi:hypothetical protein
MLKSGFIMGAVMFLLALGAAAIISPLCTPCVALLAGLGAGYLACHFDRPLEQSEAFRKGAIAGAIAGGLGIIGQLIAAVINANLVQPEMLNQILGQDVVTPELLWISQLGGALCIGLFNVLLMAGLGIGGAAIWRSMKKDTPIVPPPAYTPPQ